MSETINKLERAFLQEVERRVNDAWSAAFDAGYAFGEKERKQARDRITALEADLAARDERVRVLEEALREVVGALELWSTGRSAAPNIWKITNHAKEAATEALKGADDEPAI